MIHALPGMGADSRMFPHPWNTLPDFAARDWPPHTNERCLADVAQTVCKQFGIQDGDTLVGASLGGMVALEIAKIRNIRTVYLVGSAVRKDEVNRLLTLLHPLARIAPFGWLQLCAEKIPSELAQMFSAVESSLIRAMCSAVFHWEGNALSFDRIVRIHGKHDLIIPPPSSADLMLDGGHLISMTHAKECVAFIREHEQKGPPTSPDESVRS